MKSILQHIKTEKRNLAVWIDPDKINRENVSQFLDKVNNSIATHIFVGGSLVLDKATEVLITAIKPLTKLPVVLFPGDVCQVTNKADAILIASFYYETYKIEE